MPRTFFRGRGVRARPTAEAEEPHAFGERIPKLEEPVSLFEIDDLRSGRKTTKCFGRTATLRQPGWGFAFNPALRFLLRDEAGNMLTFAVGPGNSNVPSRS